MTAVAVAPLAPARSEELRARPSATGRTRISSLDGMRALGVLLIMGFHFGVSWLPGGFVGVDLFYVLSGYLITGLLVGEYRRAGRIGLPTFWLGRARRLLPALFIVLVVVTLLVRYDSPAGLYPDFRMSALSSLFYFSNWWQIAASGNYFVTTAPASPLTHTWSLAVEEQFYLVWPLLVVTVMHLGRTFQRGIRILLGLSVVGAAASVAEMALRWSPSADTTRLYFGTDTHAESVLVGATIACLLTLVQARRGQEGMAPAVRHPVGRILLVLLGAAGATGLLALSGRMVGTSGFTYRGGIALSALCSAALLLAAVCVPGAAPSRLLSLRPLVWIGTVSYGAYLWHYPIYVFVNATATGLTGWWLLLLRFTATFAICGASYYLVERPIMVGSLWRSVRAVAPALGATAATVVVVLAGTVAPATAAASHVTRFASLPFTTSPANVVVLGDSTAETLGVALQATAPPGTAVADRALFGCGLAMGTWVSNNPPKPELPMFPACNQGTPPDGRWPALDTAAVARTGPGDVVLFVAGNWECQDVEVDGRWTDITHPAFQRDELRRMQQLVGIATAHGAHLDLATMPAMAAGAAFHEAPFPEDSPARRATYNHLVRTVAAQNPGRVSVLDLGGILSPDGRFTQYIDGVQVRTADGVHTPSYAPGNPFAGNSSEAVADRFYQWISGRIWPPLLRSAAAAPPGREAGGRPVRFMMVGDSIATTLTVGLAADSVPRFGVDVVDQTALGCDLDDLDAYTDGNLDIPVSPCVHWASAWRSSLASVHPDVVGVLLGRWEITDHVDGGRLVHIGQPAWDAHLTDELRQVVTVLSSTGAKVVLFTMPYLGVPPTPNGTVYPENGPVRVAEFNRLLAEVAKERPGVALVDLNRLLDPAGHFQPAIDGITVRWADGIHISEQGGQWLQQFVLPTVRRLGLDHHQGAASTG